MKFLRTVSTRRLLALIAGVAVVIGGGSAIAVAASSGGPTPPPASLASAVHGALSAKSVPGISAQITFTNNLISSTDIQGPTDPILQGASGRLWFSPATHELRIELQSDNGDGQVVVRDGKFWVYDPASQTAYEGSLPAMSSSHKKDQSSQAIPSIAQIQSDINRLAQHANLSGAIPSDVGGQATYTIRVSPKHDGGLLGDAQLAFDAAKGVPLRIAVYANGDGSPVLELKATGVSYGPVPQSDFAINPPSGAKIVKVSTPGSNAAGKREAGKRKGTKHAHVSGVAAVASRVPFALAAPGSLVGQPRRSVDMLDWSGKPAALVTYGENVGGIAVIEQSSKSTGLINPGGAAHGLTLPKVSIDGATGQELDTALGTMVRFTRGDVTYTVIGSVPPAAAEAAARAL